MLNEPQFGYYVTAQCNKTDSIIQRCRFCDKNNLFFWVVIRCSGKKKFYIGSQNWLEIKKSSGLCSTILLEKAFLQVFSCKFWNNFRQIILKNTYGRLSCSGACFEASFLIQGRTFCDFDIWLPKNQFLFPVWLCKINQKLWAKLETSLLEVSYLREK